MENMRNKGIDKRKNGTFQAYVMISNNGNRSKRYFKAHVGTYDTLEEAVKARINFINGLK